MYGPNLTFLGIDSCSVGDPGSFAGADVVVIGAPYDAGTSYRPGARFGPQAIRMADWGSHSAGKRGGVGFIVCANKQKKTAGMIPAVMN